METVKRIASERKELVNFYFFGGFSLVLYTSLFFIYFLKPAFGDNSLALRHDGLIAWLTATLLILAFIYSLVLKNVQLEKVTVKKIIIFAIIFNVILFLVKPLGSADIYTYIYRGRIISEYGQNPYIVPYSDFPQDYFYSQLTNRWTAFTAIYGPAFMLFSGGLTNLSQESFFLNIFLFKSSALFFNLACIFLVWRITKSKKALFLYSWNPLINFELVNNAHNDSLMVFLLLLSIYFLVKAKKTRDFIFAWLVFWASVLVKFFTLIFAPLFLIFILNRLSKTKKAIFIVYSAALSIALTLFLYSPFWEGSATFGRVIELVGAQNILASLGVVVVALTLKILGFNDFYKIAGIVGKVSFIFLYLTYLIKVFEKKNLKNYKNLFFSFILVSAGFFLLFFNWFFPWYFVTLIAVFVLYLGLSGKFRKVNYLYAITFLGMLYYIVLR